MAKIAVRRNKDIPGPDEWTGGQKLLMQGVFILLGVSCLAIWGGLLNMLHDLEHIVYPGYSLGDTILATCMTTVLIMTIVWIALDRVSIRLVYLSCLGITLCCFLIAIVVAFVPGQAGVVCLHLVALLIGLFKGTLYPMSFGLSGVMPEDKGGACAVGLGLAGVYSLLLYLTLTVWGFTVTTYEELMPPFWIFCTLLSLPSFCGSGMLYYLIHQPWVYGNMGPKVCEKLGLPVLDPNGDSATPDTPLSSGTPAAKDLEGADKGVETKDVGGSGSQKGTGAEEIPLRPTSADGVHKTADADSIEDPAELARMEAWKSLKASQQIRALLVDCWKPLFAVGWVFFVTLQLYPNVGPLAWEDGRINSLYMMAAFQGLEYVARMGCDSWNWAPGQKALPEKEVGAEESLEKAPWQFKPLIMFKPISPDVLVAFVSIRTLFIPLFVFCMVWPEHPFWGALWWHYVLVGTCGFTLGWAGSTAVYFAPNCLGADKPKTLRMQAGQAMVFCTNFGIWIALWIGKLYFL